MASYGTAGVDHDGEEFVHIAPLRGREGEGRGGSESGREGGRIVRGEGRGGGRG